MQVGESAELIAELNRLANAQFDTPEFRHLLAVQLTIPRAQCYLTHMAHYTRNRRDCWGHLMGAAPLDVKRLIWAHEQEELIRDPRAGTDHATLSAGEAGLVGLSSAQVEQAELLPGAIAAFYAWIHLAKDRPWLEAFAASSMLERRNDSAVVEGGGMSYRRGMKLAQELGIPLERNTNATVHMNADVEHASMLE
ncbi:MAG: hypothetical protein QOF51_944, partial [Chloroflexota bacterium]|nr:hypothetical protein [Chloroflexota bacterium]